MQQPRRQLRHQVGPGCSPARGALCSCGRISMHSTFNFMHDGVCLVFSVPPLLHSAADTTSQSLILSRAKACLPSFRTHLLVVCVAAPSCLNLYTLADPPPRPLQPPPTHHQPRTLPPSRLQRLAATWSRCTSVCWQIT